ncbi:MAG TPA: hypothetical protein VFZ57_09870, partial [Thermoanaerobaculia bacterium]|nr:hypothetical protein [Thermoanaerobaculia bacterium]
PTDGTCRIRLGNHWHTAAGDLVTLDDARADLPRTLEPGASAEIALLATAPAAPGRYVLALDLVQEDVAWFGGKGSPVFHAPVRVRGGPGARLGALFGAKAAPGGTVVTDAADDRLTLRSGGTSAVMRMQPVPKEEVLALVGAAGGRTVEVLDDPSAGREWRSFRYAVTRQD